MIPQPAQANLSPATQAYLQAVLTGCDAAARVRLEVAAALREATHSKLARGRHDRSTGLFRSPAGRASVANLPQARNGPVPTDPQDVKAAPEKHRLRSLTEEG